MGEIVIRIVEDRILLSLADIHRFTADIALLYNRAPQYMFKSGQHTSDIVKKKTRSNERGRFKKGSDPFTA